MAGFYKLGVVQKGLVGVRKRGFGVDIRQAES